jgi:hypothetical protein
MSKAVGITDDWSIKERIVGFNLMPFRDLDESWLDAVPHGHVYRHLNYTPEGERWFSQHLLETFNLKGRYWEDFSAPRTRLALLDKRALQDIFLFVGLVLHGPALRAEVSGVRLKRLRAAIGAKAMEFTFKTAPLLGEPPAISLDRESDDDRLSVMLAGAAYSVHGRIAADSAYGARFAFRLPQSLAKRLEEFAKQSTRKETDDALPALTRRVMKEVAPSWLPLFN